MPAVGALLPAAGVLLPALAGGAATGLVGSLTSGGGGGRETQRTTSNAYQPQYSSQIDQILYNLMNQQANMASPYGEGSQYANLANTMMSGAQGMQSGQYSDLLNKHLTGAFDNSQNAVYQNLLRNTQQGTRSAASARGLNVSPYGGGLENEAVRQMNLSWAAGEQERQQRALQNYLAGKTGIQGLGQNALSTATSLEALKRGWNQPSIENMLNYLGKGAQGTSSTRTTSTQAQSPWAGALTGAVGGIDWGKLFNI